MRFKEFLILNLLENVDQDRTTLTFQAKAINPTLTDQQIKELLDQIKQEEDEKYTDKSHAEYTRSVFARKRLKELLGQTKNKQTIKEDPNIRKAKGINAKYYPWILKVNETMPMMNIERSVFDYLSAFNISPNTDMTYAEVKEKSDEWHKKFENEEKHEYELKLDDPEYAYLIEPIRDMFMVQVTEEDQVAEGKNMKHCAGELCRLTGSNDFYSLRDKNNEPHVTIEINNNKIVQIKSKANQAVRLNYSPYVVDWLLNNKNIKIETLDGMQISDEDFKRLKSRLEPDVLLSYGISNNKKDIIELAIEKKANIKILLNFALKKNKKDLIELALRSDVKDINIFTEDISEWAYKNNYIDIIELLIKKGAWSFGNKAIKMALEKEDIYVVKLLAPYATDMNSLLITAIRLNNKELIKLFLENGANNFNEALYEVSLIGNKEFVELFLDKLKEGNPKFLQNYLNNALYQAALGGHINIVKLLIEEGANDFDGAIFNATQSGHIDIVKLLINKVSEEFDSNSIMSLAASRGRIDIVELMIKKGADDFEEAFLEAIKNIEKNQAKHVIYLMLDKYVNKISQRSIDEAIRIASRNNNRSIVKLLAKHSDKFNYLDDILEINRSF